MKISLLACLFATLIFPATCDSNDPSDDGTFHYQGFDSTGALLIEGTLFLDFQETNDPAQPTRITGSWDLALKKEADKVGPQVGEGDLEGSIDADGNLFIQLNPGWADNNVGLGGAFTHDRFGDFAGRWDYTTFIGPTNGGTFKAERK